MDVAALKAETIKKALEEIQAASARVRQATGAQDIFDTIERNLPIAVSSLRDLEEQLNNPDTPYQTVLQLRDRWVDGWKECFARYLRINNANAQLAAELSQRKTRPGTGGRTRR